VSLALWLWLACGPVAPEPVHYTVKRGDTLFLIGKAQGVTVDQLKTWNHLQSDRLEVGQDLVLYPADAAVAVAVPPKKKRKAKRISGTTLSAPPEDDLAPETKLTLPAEKPCLAGPADVSGDEGMSASKGLAEDDVRHAMSGFLANTLRCMSSDTPTATVDLDITVACTGRVAKVEVADDGGMPPAVVSCIRDVLQFAPFPAHDYPDGFEFSYPLRYQAP
jgi:murein DD-endopeptidase MepM/ murein hydrolase activator NlpD